MYHQLISQKNKPQEWTFLCIWYENSGFWVHEIKRLCFRFTWPCVYPSIYGSGPPVSTRISRTFAGSQLPSSRLSITRVSAWLLVRVLPYGNYSCRLLAHSLYLLLLTCSVRSTSLHLSADVFPTRLSYLSAFLPQLNSTLRTVL